MDLNFFNYLLRSGKRKKTVFIVEDNAAYARALETYLKSAFPDIENIRIFTMGEAAMPELNANPSVIIMDHFLNSSYADAQTGLDTIKEIKARKPHIPVMLLSAQEDIGVAVEATQKYNCRYIRKNDKAFGRVEEYLREIWT